MVPYYIDPSRDRNQSNRGQQGRPVDGPQVFNNRSETVLKTTATASTEEAAEGPSTALDIAIDTSDMEFETTIIYNDGASTVTIQARHESHMTVCGCISSAHNLSVVI